MKTARQGFDSGARARALGLLVVSHPLPSATYVVAVGMLAWLAAISAHHELEPGRLALLLVGVACTQIATGAANDVLDLDLDRASRPDKPLVRGTVTTRQASTLAWIASAGVVLAVAPLGLAPLTLCLVIEGLGLAYDFGLKGTPVSALLFASFFPLLPFLAWYVFGDWRAFPVWLVPVLALLGVAMNIASSMADLEDDIAHGVRGFPHVLGRPASLALAWSLPLVSIALIWLLDLSGAVPASLPGLLLATVAAIGSVAVAGALTVVRPSAETMRTAFTIQALGVLGIGGGWLIATVL